MSCHVTPGWHPVGNKGRRARRDPLLLACDEAGELVFGADRTRKAIAARMYHPDLIRHPDSCPALVLNADYTPLTYYPLSLWPWQTAVKAMFLERVDVVAHYDREVHSPSLALKLPSVIALRQFVRPNEYPAFTRFNLFLRDRFRCVYCGVAQGADLRPCRAARPGRADDLGECRHRLRAVQSQEGRAHAAPGAHAHRARADPPDQLAAAGPWQELPAQLPARRAGATISTGTSSWSRRAPRCERTSRTFGPTSVALQRRARDWRCTKPALSPQSWRTASTLSAWNGCVPISLAMRVGQLDFAAGAASPARRARASPRAGGCSGR